MVGGAILRVPMDWLGDGGKVVGVCDAFGQLVVSFLSDLEDECQNTGGLRRGILMLRNVWLCLVSE